MLEFQHSVLNIKVIGIYIKKKMKYNDSEEDVMLKKALISTLKGFVNFCEQHNLRYYVAFGTALGAVRHHGIIPWDDDIDVYMPREDYNKFLS